MHSLIRRICENNNTGLQLINQPTGSGKTFSTNRFIHDYFTEGSLDDKRNIVVVTTNKNNLDFKRLKEMFAESNDHELFNDLFLYLDAISNMVIDGYDESMNESIYSVLGHNPTVGNFITSVGNIKRSIGDGSHPSPAVDDALQNFGKNIEPPFRRLVRNTIRNLRHGYDERLRLLENDKDWNWVTKIYPTVYTRKKKLFFMSADKFVTRNDTIIDLSSIVYESMIVNDAIVFIDEFDSTKNQILAHLVEESVRNRVDYLDMFQKIYQGGFNPDIDPELYIAHEDVKSDLRDVHKAKMNALATVRRKYHLESPVVLDPETIKSIVFLFKSENMHIVNSAYDGMTITYDKRRKKNIISMMKGKKCNKDFFKMFYRIDDAIEGYCSLIRIMALNYKKKADDPTLSYEDCVFIILDLYGITKNMPSFRNYLHKRVMIGSKSPKKFPGSDTSVYERGYEYFSFLEDQTSKERAHVDLVSCTVSAEKVLLKVCERSLVFGISATAEFKTVLGNYDLDYLRSRLGDEYLPSINDDSILEKQINESYGRYDEQDIRWDIKRISLGPDGKWDDSLWANVLEDPRHRALIVQKLNGVSSFYLQRYYQLSFALKALIESDTKRNGIFFCNMHPDERSPIFDKSIIENIFKLMVIEAKAKKPELKDIEMVFLKKDDFDANKRDVQRHMAKGMRAAIITSYGTFSTGQNMQFDIPEGFIARNISLREDKSEMDLDMVYLQKPTHLIHSPEADEYEKERALHLCDIHYLKSNGEITRQECTRAIEYALTGNSVQINMTVGLANETKSAHMYAAAKLTQAIGRICRTNMKNQEISIYYDEEILDYMDQSIKSYGLVSPEAQHFYEDCMNDRESPPDIKRLEDLAVFRSYNANSIIHDMLGWHDRYTIENYRMMRHDLLCNPSTDVLNNTAYQMYVELPERDDHYWCSYKREYEDMKISFTGRIPHGHRVDTEGLRFNDLFTIPGLKDHFVSKGYATELLPGKYLVSPVAAKNILMGMHGEVAGCFIIDPEERILKPMGETFFERFDYQINDRIVVDFKHWRSDAFTLGTVQHSKIIKKLKETGHDIAYIVNILLPKRESRRTEIYKQDGKTIIKVPWLYDPETGMYNNEIISEIREASYGCQ